MWDSPTGKGMTQIKILDSGKDKKAKHVRGRGGSWGKNKTCLVVIYEKIIYMHIYHAHSNISVISKNV